MYEARQKCRAAEGEQLNRYIKTKGKTKVVLFNSKWKLNCPNTAHTVLAYRTTSRHTNTHFYFNVLSMV